MVLILLLRSKPTDQRLCPTKSTRATVGEPIALFGEARYGRDMDVCIEIHRCVERTYLRGLNRFSSRLIDWVSLEEGDPDGLVFYFLFWVYRKLGISGVLK